MGKEVELHEVKTSPDLGEMGESEMEEGEAKKPTMEALMEVHTKLPDGASLEARIDAAIATGQIVMFSKSFCPFCLRTKQLWTKYEVAFVVYELDLMVDVTAAEVQDALLAKTGHRTVPCVYVLGTYRGGCDDQKNAESTGELQPLLDKVRNKQGRVMSAGDPFSLKIFTPKLPVQPRVHFLAMFPDTVANQVIRITGTEVMVLSIVCAILFRWEHVGWVTLGLFFDFCLRFVHGAPVSPLGVLGQAMMGRQEPNLKPGPPKQFAVMVGMVFTFTASMLFLFGGDNGEIGGAVVMGVLAFFAALEGLRNFCAGCWFFSHLVRLNIVDKSVYEVHIDSKPEKLHTWRRMHVFNNPPVEGFKTYTPKGCAPSPSDLRVRRRTLEQHWEDFDPIRHIQGGNFSSVLGTAAVAMVYKSAAHAHTPDGEKLRDVPEVVWKVLAIISAVHFCLFGVVYFAKAVMYPAKIRKEWYHPGHGFGILLMLLCPQLLAGLVATESQTLAKVLFWLTAPLMSFMSVIKLAELLVKPNHPGMVGPIWFVPAMVNAVTSLVVIRVFDPHGEHFVPGVRVQPHWEYEAAWMWFGFGTIMYLALWPITYHLGVVGTNANWRLRPISFFWVAAPAILAVAYNVLTRNFDATFRLLFWGSLGVWAILVGTFKDHFFVGPKFVLTDWAYSFPTSAMALASITYDANVNSWLSSVISLLLIIASSAATFTCAIHTISGIQKREIWRPEEKCGPLAFMMLTHEAMRAALPKLLKLADGLATSPEAVGRFAVALGGYHNAYRVHSRHEDEVIFPLLDRFFPGVSQAEAHEEHAHERQHLEDLYAATRALYQQTPLGVKKDSDVSGKTPLQLDINGDNKVKIADDVLIAYIQQETKRSVEFSLEHLVHEERTFTPMVAKYVNPMEQRKVNRDCWNITPGDEMAAYFKWMLAELPIPMFRSRFLKTWFMASPERTQMVGLIAYRAASSRVWAEMADQMPEIIPRGVPGWRPL